jgi:DNA-binding CsgD family transcriptional regulator
MALIGRVAERAAVDGLLRRVRDGGSGSLVLRGEAGIGKSAILEYAAAAAPGFRVLQVTGVESELELTFAALQQLCLPLAAHASRLPDTQASALRVAFGLSQGPPPDRFLVGLGVLGLAAEEAASRPVLCLADDAQWIDQTSLQSLALAARRLQSESVAVIFAVRAAAPVPELAGLPELALAGLPDQQARSLLASVVPGRLDDRVTERIIAEAAGNPLALLEFAREVTQTDGLAGGFGISHPASAWTQGPPADRVEERYLARVSAFPPPTRRLLLIAAAEPLGDPALLGRAAAAAGLSLRDLGPAELAGLVRVGTRVAFRHPLVRSAIYRSAPASERQEAHGFLAEATDPASEPDHCAWHRAHSTLGPDEAVASELERSADRAVSRGGPAAAAAFLERAAQLSPDPGLRASRTLAAAQARFDAGATGAAARLVAAAQTGPLGELRQARAEHLAARIMVTAHTSDAPAALTAAAARFGPLDAELARRTYLDAIMAAMLIGAADDATGWPEAARAARAAPPPPEGQAGGPEAQADDLLLDGLATAAAEGYAAGLAPLRRAVAAFLAERQPRSGAAVGVLWLACRTAMNLWDDESWYQLGRRLLASSREAGTLVDLPAALSALAAATLLRGDFAAATALADEADAVIAVRGGPAVVHPRLALAAWQGRAGASGEMSRGTGLPGSPGRPAGTDIVLYTTAVHCNGLGRYEEALAAAQRASERAGLLGYTLWALPELAEAAARCGRPDLATAALQKLEQTAGAAGTDWGLGVRACARAQASSGAAAEASYREAIERLGRTRLTAYLARAHLVYGEWLRREKRRTDARAELRIAAEMLSAMSADSFARRAERELAATGERIRRRDIRPVAELTPQESQIARLAADGQSNPDIGAQLFISPRTVEYHLHKIFAKLDISSRGQLARALSRGADGEGNRLP